MAWSLALLCWFQINTLLIFSNKRNFPIKIVHVIPNYAMIHYSCPYNFNTIMCSLILPKDVRNKSISLTKQNIMRNINMKELKWQIIRNAPSAPAEILCQKMEKKIIYFFFLKFWILFCSIQLVDCFTSCHSIYFFYVFLHKSRYWISFSVQFFISFSIFVSQLLSFLEPLKWYGIVKENVSITSIAVLKMLLCRNEQWKKELLNKYGAFGRN